MRDYPHEDDYTEIPEEILNMSLEEIEKALEIEKQKMDEFPKEKDKLKNLNVKFFF